MTNHTGTVHAIALCNLAELAGGLATEATTPRWMRWIPTGLQLRCLRKATSWMTATADIAAIGPCTARDVPARVAIDVRDGAPVFEATITIRISPRPVAG